MAKKRRSSGRARGAALLAKHAPKHCNAGLSQCMKGGGRRKASVCMKAYSRCIRSR